VGHAGIARTLRRPPLPRHRLLSWTYTPHPIPGSLLAGRYVSAEGHCHARLPSERVIPCAINDSLRIDFRGGAVTLIGDVMERNSCSYRGEKPMRRSRSSDSALIGGTVKRVDMYVEGLGAPVRRSVVSKRRGGRKSLQARRRDGASRVPP